MTVSVHQTGSKELERGNRNEKLHKKPLIMAAATLALTGTLAVGSAMAYFTTYSTAGGGVKMNMGLLRQSERRR